MRFNNDRPIFSQIAELVLSDIAAGRLAPGERVPSARELAASLEVNANTTARALQSLADSGAIRLERGMGYFVADDGAKQALKEKRVQFFSAELPRLFKAMDDLGLGPEDIAEAYAKRGKKGANK
jgi:DNA-binding transcriptional regulator YhcF (GntR family)